MVDLNQALPYISAEWARFHPNMINEVKMSSAVIQLLVLAGIAVFLILRLKDVLGTRDGFEKPQARPNGAAKSRGDFEVIEGGVDQDILDHAKEGSANAKALGAMKAAEPGFGVEEFLNGARGAYEMILMSFENGDMDKIEPFLSEDVFEAFSDVVAQRKKDGLKIEAVFVGVRETGLVNASFDESAQEAEISVRFVCELTSVVRDKAGDIVEGNASEIKRQKDIWTFGRKMGADNPNWQLIATGE
jgi:predicted lipid-binding transport protein (Tim44 family)